LYDAGTSESNGIYGNSSIFLKFGDLEPEGKSFIVLFTKPRAYS
jgi:hypothetical protein